MKQRGLFDEEERLKRLSELGDALEKLNRYIRWEDFRGLLMKARSKKAAGPGGRPSYDDVMMFKILILQKMYPIGDDRTEYQINDRLSFQRFLGLTLSDKVPDAKTIWHFREEIVKAGIIDKLFCRFVRELEKQRVITRSGSIIDATFIDVPKQRNTRDENRQIKEGQTPSDWDVKKTRHQKAQKDLDARWATKNGERHYGYKDHIKIDKKSKIITKFVTGQASEHDSQQLKALIEPKKDRRIYADSAYTGAEVQRCLPKRIQNRIHEKGYRNHPLTSAQKRKNRAKSKIRARVEHVFGHMTHSMGGLLIRSIGKVRAHLQIGLINLTYNLSRYAYLQALRVKT